MSKIIIGIDPDADKHGVAVYVGGTLEEIKPMSLMNIHDLLCFGFDNIMKSNCEAHIENVCGNNALFRTGNNKAKVVGAMGRSLGKVQQSQIELERLFEYHDVKIVKHKISKMWKKDKAQFEKNHRVERSQQ